MIFKKKLTEREFHSPTGRRWRAIKWEGATAKPNHLDTVLGRIAGLEHSEVCGDGSLEFQTANGSGWYVLRIGDWLLSNGGYSFPVSDDVAQEILFDAPKHLRVQTIDHEVNLHGHCFTITVDDQENVLEVRAADGTILPEQFVPFLAFQVAEEVTLPDFHEEVERRRIEDGLAAYEYDDREVV